MASAHSSLFGLSDTFLFWLLLLPWVDAEVDPGAAQNDRIALLQFKDSMTAPSVDSSFPFDLHYCRGKGVDFANSRGYWSNWNHTDNNTCSWVGVTCTANYTVERLDLSGWGLSLSLIDSHGSSALNYLTFLPDLRSLDLSSNLLGCADDSNIPESFVKVLATTRLNYLDMSSNNFSGNIPSEINASTSLRYLSLADNQLTGEIPSLDGLANLQVLLLANNQLSGQFPKELGEMSSIVRVDLSGNMLQGSIPFLSKATKLLHLDLDNNGFTEFDPHFPTGLESLEYLSVSGNNLVGGIPSGIPNLQNLQYLDLSQNNFSGSIPFGFVGPILKTPFSLDFSQNQLSGSIPTDLLQNASLFSSINLSHNSLNGHIPPLNENIDSLISTAYEALDLSYNNLSGPFPSSYSQSSVPSLSLQNNQLSGDLVDILWRYSNIVTQQAPTCSHSCTESNCTYPGPDPDGFSWCDNSTICSPSCEGYLYSTSETTTDQYNCTVQSNNMTVCFSTMTTSYSNYTPCNAHGFAFALELRLGNNYFTGDLSRLANSSICWDDLQLLDLSNNNLQMTTTEANPDPLKAAIDFFTYAGGSHRSLTELRLGGNNFSGASLPAARLGANETLLQVLDLSNSHLKGQISGAVFNSIWLPDLHFLNLSCNSITGPVPESIIQLPNLATLDVSNNSLSGHLPFIPQRSRLYNPGFFAGNGGLCGGPLPPCDSKGAGVPWWVFFLVVGGSVIALVGVATWQWRVYHKRHQQDADLIQTLLEKESTALMPMRELKRATNNFSQSSQIGEGSFGTVYKGHLDDKTMVAIKRSKRQGSDNDKGQFLNEVKILSQLNHRHLVKLLGCCMENKIALLVFEYVSNGSLQDYLRGKSGATHLSWKERLNIAVQTADGLNYLHSMANTPIYHRDVKSANILLDDDLNAKVADFGISKLAPVDATHVSTVAIQGTIGYIDPEYYISCRFTGKSDVYSFGVVLLELISAKRAIDFQRSGEETSLVIFAKKHIKSGDLQPLIDPTLTETYTDPVGLGRESILKVGRLALKCLKMRPRARPSMDEVGRELQNLWLELTGRSTHLDPIDGDSSNDSDNYSENDIMPIFTSIFADARSPSSSNHLQQCTDSSISTFYFTLD